MNIKKELDFSKDNFTAWYCWKFHCSNCHHDNTVYIKKGVKVKDVKTTECSKCGCEVDL